MTSSPAAPVTAGLLVLLLRRPILLRSLVVVLPNRVDLQDKQQEHST